MKTSLTTETDPVLRAMAAIKHVRKAFGPPGEYGYGSKQGDALFELYEAHNALGDFQDARDQPAGTYAGGAGHAQGVPV